MSAENDRLDNNYPGPSINGLKNTIEIEEMEKIVNDNGNSITVHDKDGNILMVFMGVKVGNLVGRNAKELKERGIYDWSPSAKAVETRSMVTGVVTTKFGPKQIVTSTPLMDEKGEVKVVINAAIDKDLIDRYLEILNDDKRESAELYKTTVDYLSEVDIPHQKIVAESRQMHQIFTTSNVIAKTDSTVILKGESGTGKEVVARYIHRNSLRCKGPFIPINCAAIPQELLESEFFGYVRGAFTGASSYGKPGLFEIADKGTLFLDEIAELPLAMQSKMLRVLETGEIKRVGGTTIKHANVRIIAATNRDLQTMISQKLFRSDLYYRLNVIPINLPPLRERPEDIIVLANRFLEEMNSKYALRKTFTPQAIQTLLSYEWPGNVRELRNVIERIVITSADDILDFDDDFLGNNQMRSENIICLPEIKKNYKGTLRNVLKKVEEEYIKQVLSESNGQVCEAARRLGIHRTMLYRKMKINTKDQ